MSESMTTAIERTWQITAGAVWTLLMLSVGAAAGAIAALYWAAGYMGAC